MMNNYRNELTTNSFQIQNISDSNSDNDNYNDDNINNNQTEETYSQNETEIYQIQDQDQDEYRLPPKTDRTYNNYYDRNKNVFTNDDIDNIIKDIQSKKRKPKKQKPKRPIQRDKYGNPIRINILIEEWPKIKKSRLKALQNLINEDDNEKYTDRPAVNTKRNNQLLKSYSTDFLTRTTLYEQQRNKKLLKLHQQNQLRNKSIDEENLKEETFTPQINNKEFPRYKAQLEKKKEYILTKRKELKPLINEDNNKIKKDNQKQRELYLNGKYYKTKIKTQHSQKATNDNVHKDERAQLLKTKNGKYKNYQNINIRDTSYDNLYFQHEYKQYKTEEKQQEIYNKECPFTPCIPFSKRTQMLLKDNSREATQRRLYWDRTVKQIEVKCRLEGNSDDVINKCKKKRKDTYNTNTNNNNNNCSQKNYDLYKRDFTAAFMNDYDQSLSKKINKVHNEEMCNNLEKKTHWLYRANDLVIKMKISKYKEIFNMLINKNKDTNYISYDKIDIKHIDPKKAKLLMPLVEGIKKEQLEKIEFKEFCPIADKYLAKEMFKEERDNSYNEYNKYIMY